jgi:GntR family transcriptional regulator
LSEQRILFHINPNSGKPINLQIVEQVRWMIQIGVLKPGDQLPSVKRLSEYLGVNPNTVAKAYLRLRDQGYLASLPGTGVFVSEDADEIAKRDPSASLKGLIGRAVVEALTRKMGYEEFAELVREEWKRWEQEIEKSGWEVRNLNDDERLRALVERQKKFSE